MIIKLINAVHSKISKIKGVILLKSDDLLLDFENINDFFCENWCKLNPFFIGVEFMERRGIFSLPF